MSLAWYWWLPLIGFIIDHRYLIYSIFNEAGEKR